MDLYERLNEKSMAKLYLHCPSLRRLRDCQPHSRNLQGPLQCCSRQ